MYRRRVGRKHGIGDRSLLTCLSAIRRWVTPKVTPDLCVTVIRQRSFTTSRRWVGGAYNRSRPHSPVVPERARVPTSLFLRVLYSASSSIFRVLTYFPPLHRRPPSSTISALDTRAPPSPLVSTSRLLHTLCRCAAFVFSSPSTNFVPARARLSRCYAWTLIPSAASPHPHPLSRCQVVNLLLAHGAGILVDAAAGEQPDAAKAGAADAALLSGPQVAKEYVVLCYEVGVINIYATT